MTARAAQARCVGGVGAGAAGGAAGGAGGGLGGNCVAMLVLVLSDACGWVAWSQRRPKAVDLCSREPADAPHKGCVKSRGLASCKTLAI